MDPTDLPSLPPFTNAAPLFGGTPLSGLDAPSLMARVLKAYPSQVVEGWSPSPPSAQAYANASPLMRLGLSQVYPDLFGHLAPSSWTDAQDEAGDAWRATGPQSSDQPPAAPAPLPSDPQDPPASQSPDQILPSRPHQLTPSAPVQLTSPPQLSDVSATGLDFEPTFLGVPGAAAYGRIGLERNAAGLQSFGAEATSGHATPAGQILRDGLTPTAAVNISSPSVDELSVKPVVQDGRLQMAIYDDATREKWVVDSTPGQSATLRNAKGEPILFTSTDLTGGQGRPAMPAAGEFVTGLRDSQADQNLLSLRSDGPPLSPKNLGYQESKPETLLGFGGLFKDLAVLGAGKFSAAIAGASAQDAAETAADGVIQRGGAHGDLPSIPGYERHHIPSGCRERAVQARGPRDSDAQERSPRHNELGERREGKSVPSETGKIVTNGGLQGGHSDGYRRY